MELTTEKDFKRKEGRGMAESNASASYGSDLMLLLQQLSNKCSSCEQCGRKRKQSKEIGVQTN